MARPFDFLPIPERSAKPRRSGTTTMYEFGKSGLGMLRDVLEVAGDYVDFAKFLGPAVPVHNLDVFLGKLKLYREFQVEPVPGGMLLELAILHDKVEEYLSECERLEFRIVEVSQSVIDMTIDAQAALVRRARDRGFRVVGEMGKKFPDKSRPLQPDAVIAHGERLLSAGSEKVIVERWEMQDILLGDSSERAEQMEGTLIRVAKALGVENVIFEARYEEMQAFFVRTFGPEVCLGNVEPQDVIPVEMMRRGLGRSVGFYTVAGTPPPVPQ